MKINTKRKAVLFSLCIGLIGLAAGYGGVQLVDSLARENVRTVAECNQLKGTMGQNPNENAAFLKEFPERKNELQKDNCTKGLQWLSDRENTLYIVIPLIGFSIFTVQTYQLVRVDDEQQKVGSVE